jgi:hypothetical protein
VVRIAITAHTLTTGKNMNTEEASIKSSDTVFHIAQVIKNVRNKRAKNQEDLDFKVEGTQYESFFAIFTISSEKNYFVQIITDDVDSIHAEVSTKHPDVDKLSKHKKDILIKLGWNEPDKYGYPNFWKKFDVSDETACFAAAAEIVLTMIKAFDYRTNEPIKVEIEAMKNGPDDIREETLLTKVKDYSRAFLLYFADLLDEK